MGRTPGFRAKKRDANESEIVAYLRKVGYFVVIMDDPFDLIVQCQCGRWIPMEVKNPFGKNKLTDNQVDDYAKMHKPPHVVRSCDDARAAMQEHMHSTPSVSPPP